MKLLAKRNLLTRSQPQNSIIFASLLCTICLWLPGSGHAYDVETGHTPLTQAALTAYATCFPKDTIFRGNDSNKNRLHLQLANIAMDKGANKLPAEYIENEQVNNLFNIGYRLTNWHFYNPNKTDTNMTRRKYIEQSQRRLWIRANQGFENMSEAKDKAIFLGALVHFIEDVSVPAHVVPVYHGPFIPLIFGDFAPLYRYLIKPGRTHGIMAKDAIDELIPDTKRILKQFPSQQSPACADTIVSDDSPERIRRQLAQATLDALQTQIENCKGTKWNIFWNGKINSRKNKYFEAYNINIPEFGHHGRIVNANDNHLCTMRESDQRYRQFLFDRHLDAVKADLRLLRWASQKMAK